MKVQKQFANDVVSPMSKGWFSIGCTLAFLLYLLVCIVPIGIMINLQQSKADTLSEFVMGAAGAIGIYSIVLILMKTIVGIFWCIIPCVILSLNIIYFINMPLFRIDELAVFMLIFSILATILLLSQIIYIKKLRRLPGGKCFQKKHFKGGTSFLDADFIALDKAWFSYSLAFVIFSIPCMAFAILGAFILHNSIGGVIGNALAVAIFLVMNIFAAIMGTKRKKCYQACRDKLGLTNEDINQALRHRKRGTVAEVNSVLL